MFETDSQIAFHEQFDGDIPHEETGEHLIR